MQTGMQTSLGLPFFLLTCFIIVNILLGNPGDIEILMQQWFLLGSSGVFGGYLRTQVGPMLLLIRSGTCLQLYTWHFVAFSLLAILRMNFI
jgi:hypothetical protein